MTCFVSERIYLLNYLFFFFVCSKKIQKISRYTEGWQKSLRYRDVDPDTIPGLRNIALSGNTLIGDDGLKCIVEVLKEDVWIKGGLCSALVNNI